jgi:hypothetical protein
MMKTIIRAIDFSNPSDMARHDRLVQLVELMQSLYKSWLGQRPVTR